MRYSHDSWSVDLPSGWQVEESTELVSFFHPTGVGSFEVSTFFADDGEISIDDILEFAEVENPEMVKFDYLSGIHAIEIEDGEMIYQWWLSTGNQMIFATYVCGVGQDSEEKKEREHLIDSLRSFHQDIEG